jgi:gamma-glutamyltranspeptidase/glutathione hydrolase
MFKSDGQTARNSTPQSSDIPIHWHDAMDNGESPNMTRQVLPVLFLVYCTQFLWADGGGDRITGRTFASRSPVIARNGIAATSHPLATQIAIDILKQGGSAVDAAIAANAALGLMEPTGSGVGGDLFAIVWDAKSQKLHGLNGSGRSPYSLTLEYLHEHAPTGIPPRGPLPVTVPGCVDGWFELHKRFGKLPMSTVLAPAIQYAKDGFPLTELIAHYWVRGAAALRDQPGFAEVFIPDGKVPRHGDVFRNLRLAHTYELLASGGRDAFYRGKVSATVAAFCQRVGCFVTEKDFAEHTSTWVDPVATNYRGYDVWEIPPNTQGIAVLQMLNILEPYDLTSMGHNSADYLHRLIEAKKSSSKIAALRSFHCRDSNHRIDFKILCRRTSPLLNPKAASQAWNPATRSATGDTIYLTVADKDRNMVSLIQSNYRGFGSGLTPDGLGFVLQDRGELFSLDRNHPNVYAPHKRPFHTIIPGFVTRGGKPWLSFGVMGGDMQPQGHVQVLCNLIDFGMNVQEAGDAARFHHQGSSEPTNAMGPEKSGGWVAVESGVAMEVQRTLAQKGHDVRFESTASEDTRPFFMTPPATSTLPALTSERRLRRLLIASRYLG